MIGWLGIGEFLVCNCNHPKPIGIEPRSLLLHLEEMARIKRGHVVVHCIMRASCEDLLDCAFTDQQVLLFLSRQNNRHPPPREIEGKLVDFFEAMLELHMLLQLDMVEHGNVQQVSQSGLEVTVEIGVFENTV